LETLYTRIARRFPRSEVRERARRYLAGLLERVERKNGWHLAEHLGEVGPQGVQRLLNAARWDAEAVRDDLRTYVIEHLGEPDGVLIVEETGFRKKGTKSVGVPRQDSGTAGRIENCQIGVFLASAGTAGRAFLDRARCLPQEWVADHARRREAGVPADVACATKPSLARRMLERAFAAGVPAAWVAGDEVYGDATDLRRWLEARATASVLAVSGSPMLWQAGRQQRAADLVAAGPPAAGATRSAGAGSQGERLDAWTWLRLPYASAEGLAHGLLARRSLRAPAAVAY
jgi:SRSO17 transposase